MAITGENDEKTSGCADCCGCCFKRRNKMSDMRESESVQETIKERVPFFGDLPSDLGPGKVICIKLFVLPTCLRFAINLTCGKGPDADIGFHFNPRLEQKYAVRNNRVNGRWGQEETTSSRRFEIERNKNADVHIFIGDEIFLVAVNGKHYCAFAFRVPLPQLTGIEVCGMVDVFEVKYKEQVSYPNGLSSVPPEVAAAGSGDDIVQQIVLPYTGRLPEGLKLGWQLEIYGRVKILPHSFYVNLQEGYHVWPHPVVPLHLNPRFSTSFGQNLLIRNSWVGGSWGAEERAPGFPFAPGAPFSLAIRRMPDHFSVWVDGKLTGEFEFRTDVDRIDAVYVQGDVVVQKILMSYRATSESFNSNILQTLISTIPEEDDVCLVTA